MEESRINGDRAERHTESCTGSKLQSRLGLTVPVKDTVMGLHSTGVMAFNFSSSSFVCFWVVPPNPGIGVFLSKKVGVGTRDWGVLIKRKRGG